MPADLSAAELPLFANDPRVIEVGRAGDLQYELTNFTRLPPASLWIPGSVVVLLIAHPAIERGWREDRDQFFNGPTERLAQLQQPIAF